MTAHLRPVRTADAPRIALIEAESNPNPWSESRIRELCEAPSTAMTRGWVVEQDAELVAFAFVQQVLDEGTLLNIAVAQAQRGRGLALQLLRAVLAELQGMGARCCLLEVRRSNSAAAALYRRLGFAVDGVREGYYRGEQGVEDALLMSLQLEDRV